MIGSEAGKELDVLEKLKGRRKPLTDRMNRTWGYFKGNSFAMDESEGKWETITSNRAKGEGWKMVNVLGAARRAIFIEILKEDAADRENLNYNELLVNGLLFSAERMRDGLPESPLLQYEMAFYRVVRGWQSLRVMVMEDDDEQPYLDLAVWDTLHVNYISGKNGLLKVYYERSVLEDQVREEHPGFTGAADSNGLVKLVDIWDCMVHREKGQPTTKKVTKEAVIAGGEYVREPTVAEVGGVPIDYLPIRIKAGGGVPFISSNDSYSLDSNENIAKVGEDYLVNNRDMLEEESRAMTYKKTRAGLEVKQPRVIIWDSTKGGLPPALKNDPNIKGGFLPLDEGKGQKLGDPFPMTQGVQILQYHADVVSQLNTYGLNPIAFGEGVQGETAFGVDVRNHNTREHISPFKVGLESDFVWLATEIVKQYKQGSFKDKPELGGYDKTGKWRSAGIEISKLDANKIFRCDLIIDELRDKAANAGLAIDLVGAGLLPKREALDDFQISKDPDSTLEAIAQEQAALMFDTPAVKGYLAMVEDYAKHPDAGKKMLLQHAFTKLLMLQTQEQQQLAQARSGGTSGGENPAETSRRVTARKAQPNVPGGV